MDFYEAKDLGNRTIEYMAPSQKIIWRHGGSPAWRHNNPGNIRSNTSFAKQHGAIGSSQSGFAIFPNKETGRKALKSLLETYPYQKRNVGEAITRYAPPSENNTQNYIQFIEQSSGVDSTRPMNSLTNFEMDQIAKTIEKMEGWQEGGISTKPKRKPIMNRKDIYSFMNDDDYFSDQDKYDTVREWFEFIE